MKNTIMVVDDEPIIRHAIEAIFRDDYNVFNAANGQDAVDLVRREKIDLILMDVKMPGTLDGIGALREVKKIDPTIEVIMVTAVKDKYILDDAMKYGARDYIEKPFDIDDLINRVYRIIFEKMKSY